MNGNFLRSWHWAVLFFGALLTFFEPLWETNDDVAMSMAAHGYGIFAYPSPHLIFSNIVWGYVVGELPELFGIWGYSLASLATLLLTYAVFVYALRLTGQAWWLSLAASTLIILQPLLFPQWTKGAGLASVASVATICLWGASGRKFHLFLAFFLGLLGFLIRSQEFFLIFITASPALPWRKLYHDNFARVGIGLFCAALAVSHSIELDAYGSRQWNAHNSAQTVMPQIYDHGGGAAIRRHPEVMRRHGYSENDILLLENWVCVDPRLVNPEKISAMLDEVGPFASKVTTTVYNFAYQGWLGVAFLQRPRLLVILLPAFLLLGLRPDYRIVMVWGLMVLSMFIIGGLGRPEVFRIYFPSVSLLLIAHLVVRPGLRSPLFATVLLSCALFNAFDLFEESKARATHAAEIRTNFEPPAVEPIAVIGDALCFECLFTVLGPSKRYEEYRFLSTSISAFAPNSNAHQDRMRGNGILQRMHSDDGLLVVMRDAILPLLDRYLFESCKGSLRQQDFYRRGSVRVRRIWCLCTRQDGRQKSDISRRAE